MIKASELDNVRYLLRQIDDVDHYLGELELLPNGIDQSRCTYHGFEDFNVETAEVTPVKDIVALLEAKKFLLIQELNKLGVEYDHE